MEPRKPDISAGLSHPSDCKAFSGSNGTVTETNSKKPVKVLYKECLKNHAASIGGHAIDGCGEFMPSSSDTDSPAAALKCAACGCHRNFHRREIDSGDPAAAAAAAASIGGTINSHFTCDCYLKPSRKRASPSSPSYYPSPYNSAPQMLLALSAGLGEPENPEGTLVHQASNAGTRKRFRTKFTQEQKEKMYLFSEKLGWKLQKQDDGLIQQFCNEIGIGKTVLKVWMHNNKHTFAKKDTDKCE